MFSENRFICKEPIHQQNLNDLLLMCIENKKAKSEKLNKTVDINWSLVTFIFFFFPFNKKRMKNY